MYNIITICEERFAQRNSGGRGVFMYDLDNRVYVSVTVSMSAEGVMRPINLRWENGRIYDMEHVRQVIPEQTSGNTWVGDVYRVIIHGREKELFSREECGIHDRMQSRHG